MSTSEIKESMSSLFVSPIYSFVILTMAAGCVSGSVVIIGYFEALISSFLN